MPPTARRPVPDAGLPPAAEARRARFASTRARTSLLSAPSAFGTAAVGLEPIGDVMGCIGSQLSAQYLGRCGLATRPFGTPIRVGAPPSPVVLADGSGSYSGSYVRQLRRMYAASLSRLLSEATALGADGVVDVDLSLRSHQNLQEVVAVGTAVRARSRVRPRRPFVTDLAGTQVAQLMAAGWVPVDLHVAIAMVLRHEDPMTSFQLSYVNKNNNTEISTWTELNSRSYATARALLAGMVGKAGADGCLLSAQDNRQWSKPCMTVLETSDRVAQCTLVGTSIARFRASSPPPPMLRIMPIGTSR